VISGQSYSPVERIPPGHQGPTVTPGKTHAGRAGIRIAELHFIFMLIHDAPGGLPVTIDNSYSSPNHA
jgi:hypothetical protein